MARRSRIKKADPIVINPMAPINWVKFIAERYNVDQMILQVQFHCRIDSIRDIHKPFDSQFALIVGKDWVKRYANNKAEYGGMPMCVVDSMVAAIVPRYTENGEPRRVTIEDKEYYTVSVN